MFMAGEANGSANAGSPVGSGNGSGNGESAINLDDYVSKSTYAELEKKLGEQGKELGDTRKFINDLAPLLDNLDSNPEIVEAMRLGKLDGKTAQAIIDGKITLAEANAVVKANDEIRTDMGDAAHAQLNPDELAAQIMAKVTASLEGVKDELKKDISEVRTIQDFEKNVADFIDNTPDYGVYGDMITDYLKEHPEQEDIEMVYHLVKGRALTAAATAAQAQADSDAAKAGLPPGTTSSRNAPVGEGPTVEQYVKLSPSANSFGN